MGRDRHAYPLEMQYSLWEENIQFQVVLRTCLALIVLALGPVTGVYGQSCTCTGSWSQSGQSDLLSAGLRFHPVMAVGGGDVVVAGNSVQFPWFLNHPFHVQRAERYADSVSVHVYSRKRGDLGRPEGDFVFAFPQVVVDEKGTVHMVWVEPRPKDLKELRNQPRPRSPPSFTRVYYAAYRDGAWTDPERIYHSQSGVHWVAQNAPSFVSDTKGTLHLSFPGPAAKTRIVYLRRGWGEDWKDRSPEITRPVPYVSLVTEDDGRLSLAYVSTPVAGGQTTRLFYRHSDDDGKTWSEPGVVNSKQVNVVFRPRLIKAPSGTLHLLWVTDADTSSHSKVVWHSRSADRGATWTPPEWVVGSKKGPFTHLRTAIDGCGALHLVARTIGPENDLYYTYWTGAAWSEPATPFSDDYHFGGDLFTGPEGKLHLVWSSAERPEWGIGVRSRSAVRPPCRQQ